MNKVAKNSVRLISTTLLILLTSLARGQFYHGMHHAFGKSRVQYEAFDWQKYEFDKFTVYFYNRGKTLAQFTAKAANESIKQTERFFDYPLSDQRLQLVVYQKIEHFRQSNVGIPSTDESNVGGTTQIAGTKIFLYFDGDLNHLEQQIKRGITEVMIAQMMFGENWRDIIKNSTLLHFPEWYINGLLEYNASAWDVEADDRLRDLVLRGKYNKFNRLKGKDGEVAGRSLWYYIGETYGTNVIPNILYMARVSRNVESGFLFVLGISFTTLLEDAEQFFIDRYHQDINGTEELPEFEDIRFKKRFKYAEPAIDPDGRYLAYTTSEKGKSKIWVYDKLKDRRKKMMRNGYRLDRIQDENYPILDWNPVTGKLIAILEQRGRIWMYQFDPKKGKEQKKEILRLEKVLEMSFAPDGKQILFSAINKGQTDLYLYSIAANSQKQLTNDVFDDRYPAFHKDGRVMFSSNRTNDTLDLAKSHLEHKLSNQYDLYALEVDAKEMIAERLTNTQSANETYPQGFDANHFTFLSDQSGIRNVFQGFTDSTILSIDTAINYRYFTVSEPLTNYPRNVKSYSTKVWNTDAAMAFHYDGKYRLSAIEKTALESKLELPNSNFIQDSFQERPVQQAPVVDSVNGIEFIRIDVFDGKPLPAADSAGAESPAASKTLSTQPTDGTVDIYNYQFDESLIEDESETFAQVAIAKAVEEDTTQLEAPTKLKLPEQRNYDIAFAFTELTTQFDFDFAMDLYQPFNGGPYVMPGMGSFIKIGMLDVFEDYEVQGGFRFSFNNSSIEYFASLENRVKRLDKKYIFQRQVLTALNNAGTALNKNYIHQGKVILSYPINEVNTFRTTFTARNDRLVTLASDQSSLQSPDNFLYWLGVKGEYVFDNTIMKALNIPNGSRVKVFAEHYIDPLNTDGDITILGLDARNYQRIHRDLIWANRLAAGTSFGARKLVYYMGAVDNWIVLSGADRFDFTNNIANDQGYYWQTIATNMRGFIQNARNGNNMAVINSELRWPIIKYFANRPLKSEFLTNFQVIGFSDIGSAWNGTNPYDDENAFNQIVEDNGVVKVTYQNQNDPFIGSVGWGVRSKIWGYFVRFDRAYGIQNGLFLEPTSHLSFGLDF